MLNEPSQIIVVPPDPITWQAVARWAGIIAPLVAAGFWGGSQLTQIRADLRGVSADVVTMAASVAAAVTRLEQQDRRIWKLEQARKR
jgi:hypothetical protein